MHQSKIQWLQKAHSCFSVVCLGRWLPDLLQSTDSRRLLSRGLCVLMLSCVFGTGVLLGQTDASSKGNQASQGKLDASSKATNESATRSAGESAGAANKNEPNKATPTASKDATKSKDVLRLREGHRFENLTAMIQITETERFMASIEGDKNFLVLENLALERIAEAMRVDSTDNRWVLTGRVTEFRGQNYVWVERATRAAKIAGQ